MADRVRRPLICARNVAAPNRGLCLNVPECRSNNSVSLEVDLQSRTGFFLVLTKSGAIRFVDWFGAWMIVVASTIGFFTLDRRSEEIIVVGI